MAQLDPQVQLTLIRGDSPFLIEREARAFAEAVLPPEEQAYGLTVADLRVEALPDVLTALHTGSLMAARRVVLLRNLQALPGGSSKDSKIERDSSSPQPEKRGRSSRSGGPQKALADALTSLPTNLFVVLTHVSTRERKGHAIGAVLNRLLSERGQTLVVKSPDERDLARWAANEAKRFGKVLDPAAAQLLVTFTGRDCSSLASEIVKLCTYAGKAPRITVGDVSAVGVRSAEATSFQLVDAIAEGNAKRALALLPDLVPAHNAASAAIPVVGMIARNIRLLWQASFLARQGCPVDRRKPPAGLAELLPCEQNVTEAARLDFVARKLATHARNFTDAQAAVCLELLLHADRALKGQTGEQLDPRLVVERLVTKLCLVMQGSG